MDDAGGGWQCQNLGDMYLNEITGRYEFCLFDGSGGGGPSYVGAAAGSAAAPGTSPIPGTGRPGETIRVTGTAPKQKCGYPRVICITLGISVAPDQGRDGPRDYQPRGSRGGGSGAEVPKKKKKKASPTEKPAGQDTKQSAEDEAEAKRRRNCEIWRQNRGWWKERLDEIPHGRYFGNPLRDDQVPGARRQALEGLAEVAEKLKKDRCG